MASKITSRYLTAILRTPQTIISPSILRPYPRLPRTLQPIANRFAHTIPKPTIPAHDDASSSPDATKPRKQLEPHYRLTFTCVPCTNRSTHIVSKQGYHKGSVLITCPSCRNRHVISDNLNIFGDRKITVEELLREKGQLVKRGTLGEEGDIEFWEDNPTDSSEAGEASGSFVEGEGEKDEATRLRETRDPSSQATGPRPPASVLPGDTGTRPSVQRVSHQNPTPSTRRQYHPKIFKPPVSLQLQTIRPINPTRSSSEPKVASEPEIVPKPEVNTSRSRLLSELQNTHSTFNPVMHDPNPTIASLRAVLRQEDDGIGNETIPVPLIRKEKKALKKPAKYEFRKFVKVFRKVAKLERKLMGRKMRELKKVKEPKVRKVYSETLFNGPRFVETRDVGNISGQLELGVIPCPQPRHGPWAEEKTPAPSPRDALGYSRPRRGYTRPSFLPIIPNYDWQS
ncbi:hypothetical protein E0Z10_g2048 [Xylaria hypoxylon]|uniref:DNL-type domain-containing protein n=1 Tax=Xylaria hypoxylon TaxID=37992 RepID=A0A4Z0Z564_9PEZI|nr:hypothetical protein E0Z10_g2048 [Xylaria hypoxylon]